MSLRSSGIVGSVPPYISSLDMAKWNRSKLEELFLLLVKR
jgi:hypothetical protein